MQRICHWLWLEVLNLSLTQNSLKFMIDSDSAHSSALQQNTRNNAVEHWKDKKYSFKPYRISPASLSKESATNSAALRGDPGGKQPEKIVCPSLASPLTSRRPPRIVPGCLPCHFRATLNKDREREFHLSIHTDTHVHTHIYTQTLTHMHVHLPEVQN